MICFRFILGIHLLLLGITACTFEPSFYEVDESMRQGPENTFFVGGPDGGDFLRLSPETGRPGYYSGVIFYQNKSLAYRGKFRSDPVRSDLRVDDPQQYSGFDGTQVIMADGTILIPLGEILPIDPDPL